MKKRKKTPEERAAERAYREDLDRRLRAMIARYRQLNAEKRLADERSPRGPFTGEDRSAATVRARTAPLSREV